MLAPLKDHISSLRLELPGDTPNLGWLDENGTEAGYLIRHGWLWRSGARHLIQPTEYIERVCGSCLIIRSDVTNRAGPFLTETEGMALGAAASLFAMREHCSLVPGSYLGYELTLFLSMASSIETVPTA